MDVSSLFSQEWRERHRVKIGFVFGVIFICRAQPRVLTFLVAGLLIALAGIALRQWSAGCLVKMEKLCATGPYALVRNPLYLGSFLAALGFVLAASSLNLAVSRPYLDRTLLFWFMLWILADSVYAPKIAKEEANLRAKFQDEYEAYAARVPAVLPRAFRLKDLDFSTFQWELWKKNNEVWSLAGYAFIALVLIARYHYHP